jgi:hypothetical protein
MRGLGRAECRRKSALERHRQPVAQDSTHRDEDLIILALSGTGTRAAAFSYGVLEA